MTDIDHVASKTDKTFILVCANFAMLAILFLGLGYIVLQAATIVSSLKRDLVLAEEQVARLTERIRDIEGRDVLDELVKSAVQAVHEEIKETIPDVGTMEALAELPEKMGQTADAIEDISDVVRDLDEEEIARQVSYHVLKGMGQGFDKAAESRKP